LSQNSFLCLGNILFIFTCIILYCNLSLLSFVLSHFRNNCFYFAFFYFCIPKIFPSFVFLFFSRCFLCCSMDKISLNYGKTTVIIYTQDFVQKVNPFISDNKFHAIPNDPTTKDHKAVHKIVQHCDKISTKNRTNT